MPSKNFHIFTAISCEPLKYIKWMYIVMFFYKGTK